MSIVIPKFWWNITAVQAHSNNFTQLPTFITDRVPTNGYVKVIYNITANIKCGAAGIDHSVGIFDNGTAFTFFDIGKTFAVNERDTLFLNFDGGFPLWPEQNISANINRSNHGPVPAANQDLGLIYTSSAAPAGGLITVTYGYLPGSYLRV